MNVEIVYVINPFEPSFVLKRFKKNYKSFLSLWFKWSQRFFTVLLKFIIYITHQELLSQACCSWCARCFLVIVIVVIAIIVVVIFINWRRWACWRGRACRWCLTRWRCEARPSLAQPWRSQKLFSHLSIA